MGKKRYRQLSFEDKLQLTSDAGRMQEEGVSIDQIAKEEFKKRKKEGTLDQTLAKTNTPPVEQTIEYGKQEAPQKIDLPTTVSGPIPVNDASGNMTWKQDTFEAGANRPSEVYQNLANDNLNNAIKNIAKQNLTNDAVSFQNYADKNTTPTDEVLKRIDDEELNAKYEGTYDQRKGEFEQARANAEQLNSETSTGAVPGLQKIVEASKAAITNVDPTTQLTTDDLKTAQKEVDNLYASGNPDAPYYENMLASINNNPNVRYAEPAIEKLGLTDYYPDMGSPIRVGGYSGSIVGNNDIYVAQGGLFPPAILDARARALESAAKEKAKRKEKFMEFMDIKSAYPYQNQFNDAVMDLVSKYGEKVGYNYDKLNPANGGKEALAFYKEQRELKDVADMSLKLEQKFNKLRKDVTGQEKNFMSSEQYNLMSKFLNGGYDIRSIMASPKKREEFLDLANKTMAYDNANYYIKQGSTQLVSQLDQVPIQMKKNIDFKNPEVAKDMEKLRFLDPKRDYDIYTRIMMKYVDDERVDKLAQTLLDTQRFGLGGSREQQLDYIKRGIMAYVPKQFSVEEHYQNNKNYDYWVKKQEWKREDAKNMTMFNSISNNMHNRDVKTLLMDSKNPDAMGEILKAVVGGTPLKNGVLGVDLTALNGKNAAASQKLVKDLYEGKAYDNLYSDFIANPKKYGYDVLPTTEAEKKQLFANTPITTTPVKEEVQYGHINDKGMWVPLTVEAAKKDKNLIRNAIAATVTTYDASIGGEESIVDNITDKTYTRKTKYKLAPATMVITLDNPVNIASKDSDYSGEQQWYKAAAKQENEPYIKPPQPMPDKTQGLNLDGE